MSRASAQGDVGDAHFVEVSADHFTVCKPKSQKEPAFRFLKSFITGIMEVSEQTTATETAAECNAYLQRIRLGRAVGAEIIMQTVW